MRIKLTFSISSSAFVHGSFFRLNNGTGGRRLQVKIKKLVDSIGSLDLKMQSKERKLTVLLFSCEDLYSN